VALGGADGVNFLTQYQQAGGEAPLIGGSITVDQTVLTSKGKIRDVVVGTPSAGPIADTNDTPAWKAFVEAYKKQAGAFPSPSLFAHGYYINMKAALMGSTRSAATSPTTALSCATRCRNSFDTPTGKSVARQDRNAVADIFLTEVSEGADGNLYNKLSRWCRRSTRRWALPRTSS
jgi:branched-chain amino acid transport system substrate-binding protein